MLADGDKWLNGYASWIMERQKEFLAEKKKIENMKRLPGLKPINYKKQRVGAKKYSTENVRDDIVRLMENLEKYINDDSLQDLDPLIKMAIIHYQFESIHPFYDGNGRTGRIINILYLVYKGFLDMPILYLSGYIVKNKDKYYNLIQKIHYCNDWEEWIIYMLDGIEQTSKNTIVTKYVLDEKSSEKMKMFIK